MFRIPDMRNSVILQQSDCLVKSISGHNLNINKMEYDIISQNVIL